MASPSAAAPATESTPLISPLAAKSALFSPYSRLLLTCFLLSVSFVFTATPLIYAFRTITCDVLYSEGILPPFQGVGDRCARREVESQSAESISFMVALTTLSGVLNLFTTGWITRNYGVKRALIMQTVWPCLRNLFQTHAIIIGGRTGILILQWTQLITILGGGSGYFLAGNTYVALLVTPEERTGAFGVLQGVGMLGTAVGFIAGGFTGDIFGAPAPFKFTFVLLVLSTLLSIFFLPYVPPVAPISDSSKKAESTGVFSFLSPMKLFLPRIIEKEDGGDGKRYWGLTLLGLSTFITVLAVIYVPFLLQLTATNAYGFRSTENGILMSTNSLIRALFLTLLFPKIISRGRKWYTTSTIPLFPPVTPSIPTTLEEYEPQVGEGGEEPIAALTAVDTDHGAKFDLVFARWSVFLDGCLTALTMLASRGWHMYLAASILPFASGTAPACKGVIMEMVNKDQQPDALGAIALVEMMASLLTVSLFGFVFSELSDRGLARYTFALNALLAFVAALIAVFVRFPPGHGSSKARSRTVA